ncbi:MAG: lipid-binding SYLF domain-containing protein [Desulfobacterales bacterium]|jgi:lipid-binding SYLF domain-containing protein
MRHFILIGIVIAALMVPLVAGAAEQMSYSDAIGVFQSSPSLQPFFKNAYGYALFPTVGKAAIVVGGAYGEGQVYRGGNVTGKAKLVHASIGFQLGGKAFSQIVFFQDKRAYDTFTSGDFAFDASASATAITAGADAQATTAGTSASATAGPKTGAQTGSEYKNGMATFVHQKGGLMGSLAVGGQKFSFEPM